MTMTISESFSLGDSVYVKTDTEQLERIITGIMIRPGGVVYYVQQSINNETCHYDFELCSEINQLKKFQN